MTVGELIAAMLKFDLGRVVVLSSDDEGNSFRLLCRNDIGTASFEEGRFGKGEIGIEVLTEALRVQGYSEEDVMENGVPALILG